MLLLIIDIFRSIYSVDYEGLSDLVFTAGSNMFVTSNFVDIVDLLALTMLVY